MIPLEDAVAHVRSLLAPLAPVELPLADAVGLVTVHDVVVTAPVPPFDNSAVDGFALRADEVPAPGAELVVTATVAAGDPGDRPVPPGGAARIMTGAPVPPGVDAVVMVEDTTVRVDGDGRELVSVGRVPPAGANIRPAGDDLDTGDVAVPAGTSLRPAHLGLLATVGLGSVRVGRRPVVGVLSTGDELVPPGEPPGPGRIPDSNRLVLVALCAAAGADVVDLGLVGDDEAAVEAALRDGAARCDAVVTSGGVSMGEFDPVKAVLARIADMRWMQVAIKPAKPFAFGLLDGVPVFGLPGNPVSSVVSFELFARPGIRILAGDPAPDRTRWSATAPDGLQRRRDGKIHFVRVTLERVADGWVARSAGSQGSHQLSALAAADGLAVLPDGDGIGPGGRVDVLPLDAGP
jgi:molybdopterin molybdotransferase